MSHVSLSTCVSACGCACMFLVFFPFTILNVAVTMEPSYICKIVSYTMCIMLVTLSLFVCTGS